MTTGANAALFAFFTLFGFGRLDGRVNGFDRFVRIGHRGLQTAKGRPRGLPSRTAIRKRQAAILERPLNWIVVVASAVDAPTRARRRESVVLFTVS